MSTAALVAVCILNCLIAFVVVRAEPSSAAQSLIDATETPNVRHLDLLPNAPTTATPWFGGFGGGVAVEEVAVATIGHPVRRMLLHLRREGVELKEGMSWAERGGRRHLILHLRTRTRSVFCGLDVFPSSFMREHVQHILIAQRI